MSNALPLQKITANLVVDAIEPNLAFWVERLGFTLGMQVPHGDRIGFAILSHGELELMLQTRASVAEDVAPLADDRFRSVLYLQVGDLAPLRAALAGIDPVVPERRTFYGADELIVRDPEGNAIFFATHP